ncbi:aliphatic sulfonates import ATP-binding protein SsuB 2 [Leminorella grimontii]|uniref:Aliphatic sulfonates import ATP-binding protein SsuB 2 n=1 Tax=Leminorella grimontii TaxID=82981 RepID=A0AAV5N574_9GAMM|nr:ATP-binding cassette domain-containing protein [Leminorella grimontii]KFC94951.1 ATP-binding component of an ABC superfamily sulfonate transporter [Leminorella grimontii ATCC 33999 = DSM 5078]GKX56917.1 aliphatic sulfonates import ATP-binding protein SsuB 2 [Leminorella grimontii]GKX60862.1 aliphatic sulfonates import ATP-binding protein SsuB 2 [Leminorella grimontii]VFS61153.1 Aliphatic sulfonates import ATP-binding protein SsuB [Leminorella grimontii]
MMQGLTAISKRYGARAVLENVSLSLPEGEITCLLGPSGCGKSTLLRILGGLISPDGGSVNVSPADCAMVFQEPRLLPWLTVAENLALAQPFWRSNKCAAIDDALAKVQLSGVRDMMPASLSGGMAQRVGIARALLQRPRVLLMDEPFAALDAITRAEQQHMLSGLINGQRTSCLFVTHDIHEAITIGDRILVMNQGRISAEFIRAESGYPTELKRQILNYLQPIETKE